MLLAIASGVAGAVLLLWPRDMPTQTLQFWSALIGTPLVACALSCGIRVNHWEVQQTVAEELELEQRRLTGLWRGWCRRHLRIVQVAALLPVTVRIDSLSDAKVELPMNMNRTVGFPWNRGRSAAFRRARLLRLIAVRFADALKSRRQVVVTLMLDDASLKDAQVWAAQAHHIFGGLVAGAAFKVETRPAADGARWLTQQVDAIDVGPRLVIAAQLWPDDETKRAFSEGAAAFLIDSAASKTGSIFRPMTASSDTLETALEQLMQMQVAPDCPAHLWSTACDDESVAIRSALTSNSESAVMERRFDNIVGKPGPASGWILFATAMEATHDSEPRLVAWREPGSKAVDLCMVAPVPSPSPHRETAV
ncbi:hypothetical protein [Paraburkholderia rhizosphaerae]|uniref:hypothetical protein n=1 Tax=Paraburkholderia rhizosphaerae TaxID=480658 RepID=UPI001065F98A|nr:hypothetical protein [Paraburkholderia rhizosphaerae]